MNANPKYAYYEKLVLNNYGDLVGIDLKGKNLRKFGRNVDLGTSEEQVWLVGGLETLPTDNLITHFASSNAGDTQPIVVEGHTIDASGNLTFVSQTVTLAGQTKTALTTPLARITRLYNTGTSDFAGTVYVSRDVAYTLGVPASDIHLQTDGTNNQSLKAATSISQYDYWFIDSATFSVRRNTSAIVDFRVQMRPTTGVWRTQFVCSVSRDSGSFEKEFSTPLIVPKNHDVRVLAVSSAVSTQVDAVLDGPLALIK